MGLVEEVRTLPKKLISFNLSLFGSGFAGLGHVNPNSTAVYLTITPELLQEANQRFERFATSTLQEGAQP